MSDWQELDRAIIGNYLGYISMRSWEQGKFFASALAISKSDGSPGPGFRALLAKLGLDYSDSFWMEQVEKAYACYSR